MDRPIVTYSIAACDLEAGQWGVATQSKFLGVGSVVPWAEPGVGAIATQAYANPRYGPEGLALLREGLSAQEVVERLTAADEGRDHRQVGVVDAQGLGETFESGKGTLAERLLDCLDAAQAAGGDRRGQQSAALLVVERDGGYAGLSHEVVDLRVDEHERPLEELRRIFVMHQAIFGKTPDSQWLRVDEELASELRDRLARLGYDGELGEAFVRWSGNENLEERVDGIARIDPVVLDELRRQS
jgi:uncharacterized Ntn-hydrolase superfamily protein